MGCGRIRCGLMIGLVTLSFSRPIHSINLMCLSGNARWKTISAVWTHDTRDRKWMRSSYQTYEGHIHRPICNMMILNLFRMYKWYYAKFIISVILNWQQRKYCFVCLSAKRRKKNFRSLCGQKIGHEFGLENQLPKKQAIIWPRKTTVAFGEKKFAEGRVWREAISRATLLYFIVWPYLYLHYNFLYYCYLFGCL